MLLDDFFENVYRPIRLLGKSPRTVTLYQASIRSLSNHLGRAATTEDLTDVTIGKYLQTLVDSGRRPAGINKERAQLLALWRMAARKRYVQEWPEVQAVPEPEVIPTAWTPEELWRLRISCNYCPGEYGGIPANRWWLALHCVLFSTGERIAATLQLRWSDVRDDWITFRAETRKGGRIANPCAVPPYVVDALELIRQPAREIVFVWPHTEAYLYRCYHLILERAELDTSCRSKFHRIRRSHATHLKIAGGDPTTSLRHSDPAITARYIDVRQLPRQDHLLPHFGTG